jgi:hypothetical protein
VADCCPGVAIDGGIAVGGGGDPTLFQDTFTSSGATTRTVNLASLPIDGAAAVVRELKITQVGITAGIEGQAGQVWTIDLAQAQRNAVDGAFVWTFPFIAGPPAALALPGLLYVAPFGFFAPAAVVSIVVVANVLQLVMPGAAGFDIFWRYSGHLDVMRGATRLHA